MSDNLGSILDKAIASDDASDLARLLSELERSGVDSLKNPRLLKPTKCTPRIGITGPPGAGKSTLMSALVKQWLSENKKIAVIAVDPSNTKNQGAILGDRIRYGEWITHPNIFVRSIGTRGSLGGLSSSVHLMLRAFDLLKFDVVLIETVGVGQTEVEIMYAADHVVLVLVPESGDSIQAMKSGILEIASTVVVNKSDRPGADAIKHEIENELMSREENDKNTVRVFSTVATSDKGVPELSQHLMTEVKKGIVEKRKAASRLKAELKSLLREDLENYINAQMTDLKTNEDVLGVVLHMQNKMK